MHLRMLNRKAAGGGTRRYVQLVESYRRPDGMPTTRVLAHLGVLDDVIVENLKAALAASREGQRVERAAAGTSVEVLETHLWLPLEVICAVARRFGLSEMVAALCPAHRNAASTYVVIEALIAQRCLEPDSKLAFQRWLPHIGVEEVFGVAAERLNNTRVHRALEELARIDESLQGAIAKARLRKGTPRLLFLDVTDTWFVAGGGNLARRGQTKEGHRSKWKINIALLVDEDGFPLRWELLKGALSETTILPSWVKQLANWPEVSSSVLVFDRGMPSIDNLRLLTDEKEGRPFLTSIKSDSIPTYVNLDEQALDALQALPADANQADVAVACEPLLLTKLDERTYARDLGVVEPPAPRNGRRTLAPTMRMYIYFNPEMQRTRRDGRQERLREAKEFVDKLNEELSAARQPRNRAATERKVMRVLEKNSLCELYDVELEERSVAGRTKPIASWKVHLKLRESMLKNAQRFDGVTLLVGHPDLALSVSEAVSAYRHKNAIEADFRTIKSVLNIRPTFHWTDDKIKAHVTVCMLALLVERLIEFTLRSSTLHDAPATANALLSELSAVRLTRLRVGQHAHTLRVATSARTQQLLAALDLQQLLDKFPSKLDGTHDEQKQSAPVA